MQQNCVLSNILGRETFIINRVGDGWQSILGHRCVLGPRNWTGSYSLNYVNWLISIFTYFLREQKEIMLLNGDSLICSLPELGIYFCGRKRKFDTCDNFPDYFFVIQCLVSHY